MAGKFDAIVDLAAGHHGGRTTALEKATNSHLAADYAAQPLDRVFSVLTKCVFTAGFNWSVVDAKWDGFEAAFEGFDVPKLAFFGDEMLDRLVSDNRIIRNGQKIKATLENAKFLHKVEQEEGGFARRIADWPADDQLGLMTWLHKNGSRLGGATAQYFLRFSGWDAWITSGDVTKALVREGVLEKPAATTKTALGKVQAAFNAYHDQSGLPRSQISRLLSLSVG